MYRIPLPFLIDLQLEKYRALKLFAVAPRPDRNFAWHGGGAKKKRAKQFARRFGRRMRRGR